MPLLWPFDGGVRVGVKTIVMRRESVLSGGRPYVQLAALSDASSTPRNNWSIRHHIAIIRSSSTINLVVIDIFIPAAQVTSAPSRPPPSLAYNVANWWHRMESLIFHIGCGEQFHKTIANDRSNPEQLKWFKLMEWLHPNRQNTYRNKHRTQSLISLLLLLFPFVQNDLCEGIDVFVVVLLQHCCTSISHRILLCLLLQHFLRFNTIVSLRAVPFHGSSFTEYSINHIFVCLLSSPISSIPRSSRTELLLQPTSSVTPACHKKGWRMLFSLYNSIKKWSRLTS